MLQDLGKFVARMDLKLLQLAEVAPFDVLARQSAWARTGGSCTTGHARQGHACAALTGVCGWCAGAKSAAGSHPAVGSQKCPCPRPLH